MSEEKKSNRCWLLHDWGRFGEPYEITVNGYNRVYKLWIQQRICNRCGRAQEKTIKTLWP